MLPIFHYFVLMIQPLSRKVILYSSLFITTAIGLPRLLFWKVDGIGVRLVPFNIYEWLIQFGISFLFCVAMFSVNKNSGKYFNQQWNVVIHGKIIMINLFILLLFVITGGLISRLFIQSKIFPLNGNLVRLVFATILIFIELKILTAVAYAQQKEVENDQLRHANTKMELELLKSQLNPHFFFNALSSLSGVVREDQQKAQQYIFHLSKIFRYSLSKPSQSLVTLKEELNELNSYCELMKMRHEAGFVINKVIDVDTNAILLPQMSLQPIVENALKHNIATIDQPLEILITVNDNLLVIQNNLQLKQYPEAGTGIGLANLNERYKILLHKEIEIIKTANSFTIKLPLQ